MNIYEITTQEFYLSDFGNAAFHSFVKSIFFGTIKIKYFIKEIFNDWVLNRSVVKETIAIIKDCAEKDKRIEAISYTQWDSLVGRKMEARPKNSDGTSMNFGEHYDWWVKNMPEERTAYRTHAIKTYK